MIDYIHYDATRNR